jgi:hypothetical protein
VRDSCNPSADRPGLGARRPGLLLRRLLLLGQRGSNETSMACSANTPEEDRPFAAHTSTVVQSRRRLQPSTAAKARTANSARGLPTHEHCDDRLKPPMLKDDIGGELGPRARARVLVQRCRMRIFPASGRARPHRGHDVLLRVVASHIQSHLRGLIEAASAA